MFLCRQAHTASSSQSVIRPTAAVRCAQGTGISSVAVVPFTHSGDNPCLQPAEPGTAGAQQFPDIFAVHALVPNAHTMPSELYLPRKKGVDFNELTCPFGCGTTYLTKATLQRHRCVCTSSNAPQRISRTNSSSAFPCSMMSTKLSGGPTATQKSSLCAPPRTPSNGELCLSIMRG